MRGPDSNPRPSDFHLATPSSSQHVDNFRQLLYGVVLHLYAGHCSTGGVSLLSRNVNVRSPSVRWSLADAGVSDRPAAPAL